MSLTEPRRRAHGRVVVMTTVTPGDPDYPDMLVGRMSSAAPAAIQLIGNAGLLRQPLLAWFASGRLPADLVIPALHMARRLREEGAAVVSGFHSLVERECLEMLLAGRQPVVVCPARSLHGARLPPKWRGAVEDGRVLILSTLEARVRRPSARSAAARNGIVAALAERVFIAGATPGGRLHALAREVASRGQQLACFDHSANRDLLLLGAAAVPAEPAAEPRAGREPG